MFTVSLKIIYFFCKFVKAYFNYNIYLKPMNKSDYKSFNIKIYVTFKLDVYKFSYFVKEFSINKAKL